MLHRASSAGNYGQSGLGTGCPQAVSITRTSLTVRRWSFAALHRYWIACALVRFVKKEQQGVDVVLPRPSRMRTIRTRQLSSVENDGTHVMRGVFGSCPEANGQKIRFRRRNAVVAWVFVAMGAEGEELEMCGDFVRARKRGQEGRAWDIKETLGTSL